MGHQDNMIGAMILGQAAGEFTRAVAESLIPLDREQATAADWRMYADELERRLAKADAALSQARADLAESLRTNNDLLGKYTRLRMQFRGMNELMIDVAEALQKAAPSHPLTTKATRNAALIKHMQDWRTQHSMPPLGPDEIATLQMK